MRVSKRTLTDSRALYNFCIEPYAPSAKKFTMNGTVRFPTALEHANNLKHSS